jgi:hypothetical protein
MTQINFAMPIVKLIDKYNTGKLKDASSTTLDGDSVEITILRESAITGEAKAPLIVTVLKSHIEQSIANRKENTKKMEDFLAEL